MTHRTFARGFSALVALTAVVAMLAPLAGPALDHHFAERQPDHLHFGTPGAHTHAFESAHHLHRHPAPAPEDGGVPIALYRSEGSIVATLAASPVDVDSASMRRFQPTSVFILPASLNLAMRQHTPTPSDKPPAFLTQHPAGFPIHPLDAA